MAIILIPRRHLCIKFVLQGSSENVAGGAQSFARASASWQRESPTGLCELQRTLWECVSVYVTRIKRLQRDEKGRHRLIFGTSVDLDYEQMAHYRLLHPPRYSDQPSPFAMMNGVNLDT